MSARISISVSPGKYEVRIESTRSTPAAQLEESEEHARLQRAVAELPRPYREVVVLCVFEERPFPEVARSLGISRQALRTRMCRARAQLKEWLAA